MERESNVGWSVPSFSWREAILRSKVREDIIEDLPPGLLSFSSVPGGEDPKSWNQWKGMLGVPWLAVSLREWFARTRSTFISKRTSLLRVDRLIRADSLGVTDRPVLDYESWPAGEPDQVMFNRVSPALAVNRLTFNGWTDSGPDWSTAYKRKKEAAVDQVPNPVLNSWH